MFKTIIFLAICIPSVNAEVILVDPSHTGERMNAFIDTLEKIETFEEAKKYSKVLSRVKTKVEFLEDINTDRSSLNDKDNFETIPDYLLVDRYYFIKDRYFKVRYGNLFRLERSKREILKLEDDEYEFHDKYFDSVGDYSRNLKTYKIFGDTFGYINGLMYAERKRIEGESEFSLNLKKLKVLIGYIDLMLAYKETEYSSVMPYNKELNRELRHVVKFIRKQTELVMLRDLETIEVNDLRKNEFGGTLGDIDCKMWSGVANYSWKNYRNIKDKVNWAHEGTHSINSRIRNTKRVDNGYYLLNNVGVILSNPDFSLRDVARAVPKKDRIRNKYGDMYKNYLVDSIKHWNDSPFYVLDELVSYINGTLVGIEAKTNRDRTKRSFERAKKMFVYCKVAQSLCEDSYKDKEKLGKLMDILENRIKLLEESFEKDLEV